jgi:hypothetical protein
MEQRISKQNAKREGKPFVIYGLICPVTLELKYVGQTIDLNQRTRSRTHGAPNETALKEWIASLGDFLRPYRVILERGINRVVRVKVMCDRKTDTRGPKPCGYKDVWLSSCLETKWIKRFQKTVLNRRVNQLPTVFDALLNPPLPWDVPEEKTNALE